MTDLEAAEFDVSELIWECVMEAQRHKRHSPTGLDPSHSSVQKEYLIASHVYSKSCNCATFPSVQRS